MLTRKAQDCRWRHPPREFWPKIVVRATGSDNADRVTASLGSPPRASSWSRPLEPPAGLGLGLHTILVIGNPGLGGLFGREGLHDRRMALRDTHLNPERAVL